ncbi:apextrin [Elysia marginata]|uniref:Apextrin n=1 Tax=Elysia marginata TaxID=1093978 RepID=A0AAV4F359_9GAST|nr:apextrin [Elysia marginata]
MILHQFSLLTSLLVLHPGVSLPVQDVSDPSMPFQLTVTPALVNRYTAKKMSVRCEHNVNVPTKLVEIFRIRIVKQSTSGWDLVAEQRDNEDSPTVTGNVTALANSKGEISQVFLQLTYDNIGPDCFGVYKCEVIGFDVASAALTERSSTLEVFESKNFINHLIGVSEDTQEKVQEMKNVTEAKIASLETNLSIHETRLVRMESNQASTKDRVAKLETLLGSLMKWPAGYYALLQPKTGCPVDLAFYGGNQAFLKIHTQSQSSSDPADSYSGALSSNTLFTIDSKNYVTLEFCEVTPRQMNTASWPQGSFCVHKLVGQSCPVGFSEGYVRFDSEDSYFSGGGRSNVATGVHGHPYLYFCCQNTASANAPIQLPTHSPFVLYRYGGVCQAVQGMSVSSEYIRINTEDSGGNDNKLYGSYPDVDLPGSSVIKFNLCYYIKL